MDRKNLSRSSGHGHSRLVFAGSACGAGLCRPALVLLTGCVAVPMDAYDPGAPVVYSDRRTTARPTTAVRPTTVRGCSATLLGPGGVIGHLRRLWRQPRALARAARAWSWALGSATGGRRRPMAPSSRRGRWAHAASAGRRGRPRSTPAVRCQPLAARHRNRQPGRQRRWARRPQYALSGERRPAPEWAPAKCPMIGSWPFTKS